jgi:hypothetical protein
MNFKIQKAMPSNYHGSSALTRFLILAPLTRAELTFLGIFGISSRKSDFVTINFEGDNYSW